MSVSVFFSNKSIQVVVGSSKGKHIYIDKLIDAPMPENSILNGVVIGDSGEAITAKLKEIWAENKLKGEVDLIINSPQLISNRVDMPVINKVNKATEYLDKQASDEFGRFETPIKGWYLIGMDTTNKQDKKQLVVTEVAERKFLETYIKIFADAGITLASVHDGVNLATQMLSTCIGGSTAIYMIRDAQMLVTILYENGKYYYNTLKRLFQQPGTEEFAQEIRSNISGIKQFATSKHLTTTITDVYFAGMNPDEVGMLQNYLRDTEPDISVHGTVAPSHIHFRKWNDKLNSFVYPISGLMIPKTGFTVLKAIKQTEKGYTQKKAVAQKSVPAVILAAALLLVTLFMLVVRLHTASRLRELESYNSRPDVLQAVMEYDDAIKQSTSLGEQQGGLDTLRAYLDSYPIPDSSINNAISNVANKYSVNIEFNSYDAGSGVFSITASSPIVENINKFIADLLYMDIFEDVDYTGYSWNESDETWSIKVICTLSGQSEKEEN
ncbi:MAG: hypothetical protein IKN97_07680 [Lachnospiraceae bacterium]|nr:hypothetical protein [Lachnospiraceae bacterium]